MPIKQISISLGNTPEKFSEVLHHLAENEVNIIGLSVTDTADISTVRIVANNPLKALNILKSYGYSVKMTDVLALEISNYPGDFKNILKSLKEISVNINYLYTCLRLGEKKVLIMGVDEMEESIQALRRNGLRVYEEMFYILNPA